MDATSEATYLFFRIDNPFGYKVEENGQTVAKTYEETECTITGHDHPTIHEQMLAAGWVLLPGYCNGSSNIYYYAGTTGKTATDLSGDELTHTVPGGSNVATFSKFMIAKTANKDKLEAALKNQSLTVAVYAVQASGFPSYIEAANVFADDFTAPLTAN